MSSVPLLTALDELERAESAVLTWGFVDAGFSEQELLQRLTNFFGLTEPEAEDLLEELIAHELVVRSRTGRRVVLRTRSAEAIRLLARLRQLFPRHLRNGSWRNAPTLVSDFRYSLRARTYPSRTIPSGEALAGIVTADADRTVRQALAALLDRGSNFRLARFQVQAARRILQDLDGRSSRGTIIGAGTGSGKTLAFYLPALAHVARHIGPTPWTKVIAVYPRNELLKDQFSETFLEARRLDANLAGGSRRKVTIGAFFGFTPHSAAALTRSNWQRGGSGFVCPFLRCPRCGGELIWADDDIRSGRECLACSRFDCGQIVAEDEIALTRATMRRRPPDLLFTTTEMLNRQLSDTTNGHVFGVGGRAARKPELMLLDEVHTYEGTTGAQAAYVIRRWRHAVGRPVQFVGLSATLREADTFFAQLTGLPPHAVASVSPAAADLVTEGMEYLLALRGDPVSGTSLLSTTIQTCMLVRRILDASAAPADVFGSRLFTFTDDLDVTNRLYFDLLDAEGRDSWGRINPRGPGPLAALRSSTQPEHAERQPLGQSWDVCEAIGHHLDASGALRIGRTSSQDPGVMSEGDVIVATASLDVGFNDPGVGAILQHKAPRDAAQFLQRKGRAGRSRGMRPWTIVVLSDYGRDRLAYQGYELLFDPLLEPKSLPLRNTYVLRIQATFAIMDWLASQLPPSLYGSMWLDLAGPPERNQPNSQHAYERQHRELQLIDRILSDTTERDRVLAFIQDALQITADEAKIVAWEAPRSLLFEVLPTLRRRLASGWSADGVAGADYQVRWQPAPDFVPANLFSDLNLPETRIVMPPAVRGGDATEAQVPVLQALRTFAPGRISRRFGVEHRYVRHWVPVPLDSSAAALDLRTFADGAEIGTYRFGNDADAETYRCIRPWSVTTERPPAQLTDSTNAALEWRSQFDPVDTGDALDVPSPSSWDESVRGVTVYIHGSRSGLNLSRLAVAAHATLLFEGGEQSTLDATFTLDGAPAALGFTLHVDAVRVEAHVPPFFNDASGGYSSDPVSVRSFRASYFEHVVQTDSALLALANGFQLQWLSQLYMSVLIERALRERLDLETAHSAIASGSLTSELRHALDVIFQALPVSEDEGTADEQDPEPPRQRLHEALGRLIDDVVVARRLNELVAVLWRPPDDAWQRWAAERFAATLGAALVEGVDRTCRDVGARNLVVDSRVDHASHVCEIWLSEPSIGGGGIVEEFARRYAADPRRFFRLVEAALAPSDFEIVDAELSRALKVAVDDEVFAGTLLRVRSAPTQEATRAAVRDLLGAISDRGIAVSHPVVAALNARVLRPGSSASTDQFLAGLVVRWRDEEARLGIEIDARVFSYVASESSDVDLVVPPPPSTLGDPRQRRFATIYGLLWPRGAAVRANSLRTYNPYHLQPPSDRVLVLTSLRRATPIIRLEDPSWRQTLAAALVEGGVATLVSEAEGSRTLRAAIFTLQGLAVDAGFLMLYPRIVGFAREGGLLRVRFELREAFQ